MAAPNTRQTPRNMGQELPAETTTFREWGGLNVQSPRQSIRDDQFGWLENAMPIAPGNLQCMAGPTTLGVTYSTTPVYSMTANIAGTDYAFNFFADGSATYVNLTSNASLSAASAGTFTTPTAVSYSTSAGQQGILIVDPVNGYFDFGVTTPFALTSLNNQLQTVSNFTYEAPNAGTSPTFPTNSLLRFLSNGAGAYAQVLVVCGITSAGVSGGSGGTGYVAGDILTLTTGTFNVAAQVQVTSVTAGAITAVAIYNPGTYTATLADGGGGVAVGPTVTPIPVSGGSGSGATLTALMRVTSVAVTNGGRGYTSALTNAVIAAHIGGVDKYSAYFSVSTSGVLTGAAIAVYAGRVWIASGRSISFSDVASYNSFGNTGGSLTISDSYLHDNITALYSTNGYLYVFGDDSIDTISNVTVSSAGTTSFSRSNITSSVGTTYPQSITPYYRSLMFASATGVYSLSGATPQKISDDLDGLFTPGTFVGGLIAGVVSLYGQLCVAWTLRFSDKYTTLYGTNVTRTMLVIFYKGKWFSASPGFDVGQMVSVPSGAIPALYAFSSSTPTLYELFTNAAATIKVFWQTKLWDGGEPMADKQVVRAALGTLVAANASVARNLYVTTDTEYTSNSVPAINNAVLGGISFANDAGKALTFTNSSGGALEFYTSGTTYEFNYGTSSSGGGKYYGMSVQSFSPGIQFLLAAIETRSTRPW
jgi:hypothetical protein